MDNTVEKLKEEYRKKEDYKKAIQIVREFKKELLNEDIYILKGLDLEGLFAESNNRMYRKKYVGSINDPDMYLIIQAIYIVVWGYIYDLSFEKIGSWGKKSKNQFPFRGDTMNSFNSVYGKECIVAKKYIFNENIMSNIFEYKKLYHSIGNFIVIPNRGNVNGKRANYYSMQDYFDWFIAALYYYTKPSEMTIFSEFNTEILGTMKDVFDKNKEYSELDFNEWVEKFYLEKYICKGKPINIFEIGLNIRMKEYKGRERRSKFNFYSKSEYNQLAQSYSKFSKEIIDYRADKICKTLDLELGQLLNECGE